MPQCRRRGFFPAGALVSGPGSLFLGLWPLVFVSSRNECAAIANFRRVWPQPVGYVAEADQTHAPRWLFHPNPYGTMSDPVPLATPAGHAWSALPRREPIKRHPTDRIGDFHEIYSNFDEATAREQATRCVQCPNPLCVSGCPLHSQIPEWLSLVAEGQYLEAATLLHAMGTMPEICVRLCPADRLCEPQCLVGGRAEPVAIHAVEQFLSEYAFAHGVTTPTTAEPNGWRVAVIGATLGGLACASELLKRGFAVTLIDHGSIGDAIAREAPGFRLDPAVAQRRLELLIQQGLELRPGALLGRTEIEAQFDAVYVALAASQPRRLDIPGATLKGASQAVPFIGSHKLACAAASSTSDVRGKRIVVIGAGETAIDCLRTALRAGARQAIGIYRRDEEAMPCSRREYDNAIEEGAVYVFGATPVAVLSNDDGLVAGLQLVRTAIGKDAPPRGIAVATRPGTEFEIETDRVFWALGCEPRRPAASDPFSNLADASGMVPVDEHQMTNQPGIFAGGDLVRGPCLALESVRDGRKAAEEIGRYLSARAGLPNRHHYAPPA